MRIVSSLSTRTSATFLLPEMMLDDLTAIISTTNSIESMAPRTRWAAWVFLKTPQGVPSSQWDQFLSPDRQEIWVFFVELLVFRPTRSCGVYVDRHGSSLTDR